MEQLADRQEISQRIEELAAHIRRDLDARPNDGDWAIVGIRSRGVDLAGRLAERLKPTHIGSLDITLYRDDLSEIGPQPIVRTTEIDFAIDGIDVVLVDDVLMSGRSVRAAIQSLMDLGRPRRVWLCVLVDRGGRELPIAPDQVGMDLRAEAGGEKSVAPGQRVEVRLMPTDDEDAVLIVS